MHGAPERQPGTETHKGRNDEANTKPAVLILLFFLFLHTK